MSNTSASSHRYAQGPPVACSCCAYCQAAATITWLPHIAVSAPGNCDQVVPSRVTHEGHDGAPGQLLTHTQLTQHVGTCNKQQQPQQENISA
jgi:hypothetical protein